MAHIFPRTFTIGIVMVVALFVVMSEKTSAQDYTSFYSSFLAPSYSIPTYDNTVPYSPQVFHYQPATSYDFGTSYLAPGYNPFHSSPVYSRPYPRSPFGPLPPPICGDPWYTPGLGLAGDDIPLRVCIL